MTLGAPTLRQIKAQVAAIRKKVPNTHRVAIRTKAKWTGNTRCEVDGETYFIHQCDSPLAMRLALRENDDGATTVLITDLDDKQVADDILVRLKPRKLVPLDSWQIVKALFQARTIDPRVVKHSWIADVLMELIPTEGFAPVASGFLDAESVWAILLRRVFGLDGDRPDLLALLKWSTDPDNVARFRGTRSEFRDASIEWLVATAGPTVATVLQCVAGQERPDALPIGLAAGVVFHHDAKGKLEKAAGKLEERYLGGHSPDQAVIERWAAAATEVVRLQLSDARVKQHLLQRADEILREVGAEAYAYLSDTSPTGFDLRLATFGSQLSTVISQTQSGIESLTAIRQSISQHDRHTRERRRLERVDMAMRLVRWLSLREAPNSFKSLADAASYHLSEGGYVDWARLMLRSGEPVRELSEAYAKLFELVTNIREEQSRRFAELLRDWTASKTTDELLVPVEQVLDRVVAKIASHKPVLVVVIDGMSVPVFRELMADVLGHDWLLLSEDGVGLRPGLATVPSVTEVSRTSLLCGRLAQGDAATEKAGFAEHASLLSACRSGFPPVLFHKAALQDSDDASLAGDIRREISSSHRKIVGVVVNAVDDHLLKGEQIDTRWSRDEIKVLPVLLHEAKSAGRAVILLSDHGHVLDCSAKGRAHEGGERWRLDNGPALDGEVVIRGPRVVIPESHSLIAPWTERVRYGIKKNGYHGGATPQEMVVPIAVLSSANDFPAGWGETPVDLPSWWDVAGVSARAIEQAPLQKLKPQKPKEKPPGLLFPLEELSTQPKTTPAAEEPTLRKIPDWITTLLSSPVFEEQKQLGGRAVPDNDVFARLLSAIDERGGKLTSPALARAIQFSPMRLRGLLAIAQRVLNVDGFPVLTRDEISDTVELDRSLLCRQFDIV
jgi:hypothetical protein